MKRGDPILVCSAIKIQTNKADLLLLSARHWDNQMRQQFTQSLHSGYEVYRQTEVQGFIDQFGKFYNRKDAYRLAQHNNQIRFELDYETDELYSEMLY